MSAQENVPSLASKATICWYIGKDTAFVPRKVGSPMVQ
ncbi:MAG: hypothetical protein OJF47_003065 [Nitrospira sp.]|nr:MAG: hypothetical protein OJF47_003065 [Nitrospira sp.]